MEEATDCTLGRIGCGDGSLTISQIDDRGVPILRCVSESDSGRDSPGKNADAPESASSEASSSPTLSEDEESILENEERGQLQTPSLPAEADSAGGWAEGQASATDNAETGSNLSASKDEETALGGNGLEEQRQQADLMAKARDLLPEGTSIDLGACIALGNLAHRPRCTLHEWFGPYLNVIRHAFPLSRGYVVIPKLERMYAAGIPLPYLEVRRMVFQSPVKLPSVLIIFGKNEPASRAVFPHFSDIVTTSCSALGKRILHRTQQSEIFWLGFMGFWWNFGAQRKGQEVELLSPQPQAWVDIDKKVSFYRLQQLASEIDRAFPLCTDEKMEVNGSTSKLVAVLMNHFSENKDDYPTRTLWNGPWIELLARVFPGVNGYVVQPEPVNSRSGKDPPLLKVMKGTIVNASKGESFLKTVLLFVSRGRKGPLPKSCGGRVTIDEAAVKAYMEMVFDYRFPTRWLCVPITLPVYWIYAAGMGWIGGVVTPKEKRRKVVENQEERKASWSLMPFGSVEDEGRQVESDSDDSSEDEGAAAIWKQDQRGGSGSPVPFGLLEESSDSEDESGEEEYPFEVKILTEWNRTGGYSGQSLRKLRQHAKRTQAL